MPLIKALHHILYIDTLIRKKATGTLIELAKKLQVSEQPTLQHLKAMKDFGCPIKYSRQLKTYYYLNEGEIIIVFEKL